MADLAVVLVQYGVPLYCFRKQFALTLYFWRELLNQVSWLVTEGSGQI